MDFPLYILSFLWLWSDFSSQSEKQQWVITPGPPLELWCTGELTMKVELLFRKGDNTSDFSQWRQELHNWPAKFAKLFIQITRPKYLQHNLITISWQANIKRARIAYSQYKDTMCQLNTALYRWENTRTLFFTQTLRSQLLLHHQRNSGELTQCMQLMQQPNNAEEVPIKNMIMHVL